MSQRSAKPPRVYIAISRVMAGLSRTGVAKNGINMRDGYRFRSLDDLFNALSPLLVQHRLCVLPRILERTESEHKSGAAEQVLRVSLRASFDFVCAADGSQHTVEAFGEAIDSADKATAKAMSAAFKYAMIQAFCIPVQVEPDPDAGSGTLDLASASVIPVQGWEQWTRDIIDLVEGCVSVDAVERVQHTYRSQLRVLSADRPALFREIGKAVQQQKGRFLPNPTGPELEPRGTRIPPIASDSLTGAQSHAA